MDRHGGSVDFDHLFLFLFYQQSWPAKFIGYFTEQVELGSCLEFGNVRGSHWVVGVYDSAMGRVSGTGGICNHFAGLLCCMGVDLDVAHSLFIRRTGQGVAYAPASVGGVLFCRVVFYRSCRDYDGATVDRRGGGAGILWSIDAAASEDAGLDVKGGETRGKLVSQGHRNLFFRMRLGDTASVFLDSFGRSTKPDRNTNRQH